MTESQAEEVQRVLRNPIVALVVQGWAYQGETVAPFTNFGGLYVRATGNDPFRLPQRWLDAKNRIDPETPLDVTTNNDIIGGNSGSPLIDREGRVVGAIFDGNIHSLGANSASTAPQPRDRGTDHRHRFGAAQCL